MIHAVPTSLRHALDTLPKLDAAFSPAVCLDAVQGEGALDRVPETALRAWMQDAARDEPGGDAKLQAAYLMGTITWALGDVLAGLALRGHWLASARADGAALIPRLVAWDDDGKTGVSQVFDVTLDPTICLFTPDPDDGAFASAVESILRPIVAQLSDRSGLGHAALYRLVGDSFGYAFLAHGRVLNCEDAATARATAIFQSPGTKLRNKQLRFDYITLPEAPDIGDWLRVRGGCCRAYTRPGKPNYCTTCVLRDDASRIARYRNYLRRTKLSQNTET